MAVGSIGAAGSAGTPDEEGLLPEYQNLGSYDVPGLLLQQTLEGEASWETFRRTFFDPQSLNPRERTGFRDRWKKTLGDTAAGNALVDLATNPLIYSLFLFRPTAPKMVAAGQSIFGGKGGGQYVGWLKGKAGVLHTFLKGLGWLSFSQMARDTPAMGLLHEMEGYKTRVLKWNSMAGKEHEEVLENVSRKFGLQQTLQSLNPDDAPHALGTLPEAMGGGQVTLKQYLRHLTQGMGAKLEGLDTSVTRSYGRPSPTILARIALRDPVSGEVTQQRWARVSHDVAEELRTGVHRRAEAEILQETGRAQPEMDKWLKSQGGVTVNLDESSGLTPGEWEVLHVSRHPLRKGAFLRGKLGDKGEWASAPVLAKVEGKYVGMKPIDYLKGREKTRLPQLSPDLLDGFLGEVGADKLVGGYRRITDDVFKDLFLDEKGGVDTDKLSRTFRYVRDSAKARQGMTPEEQRTGLGAIDLLMDRRVLGAVREGSLTKDDWRGFVTKMVDDARAGSGSYFPRNSWNVLDRSGESLPYEDVVARGRSGGKAGKELQFRTREFVDYDPFVMQRDLAPFVKGGTPEEQAFLRRVERGKTRFAQALEKGEEPMFPSLDAVRAMGTHIRKAAKDSVMIEEPGDLLKREWIDKNPGREGIGERVSARFDPPLGKGAYSGVDVSHPELFKSPGPTRAELPEGGLSRHDLLTALADPERGMLDPEVSRYLREGVLPRMFGERPLRHMFAYEGLRQARRAAEWLADSPLGKVLETGGGAYGKGFVSGLREWGTTKSTLAESARLTGSATEWLYSSHLANPASVVVNTLQPLGILSALVGTENVLATYPKVLKQMGQYVRGRADLGVRATKAERDALIRRTFPLTNVAGRDLLGITDDLLDTLDGVALSRGQGAPEHGMLWKVFVRAPLVPFQKAEWINRLVAGHSVERLYQKAGRTGKTDFGRMVRDIEETVKQTQFGADSMHQPQFMIEGKVFSNPLARMFLSFPIRTVTYLADTAQGIGGRGIGGTAAEVLRMLAISSVAYEVGREFLGADLSRGLAASSVTDLVGGNRFLQDRSFPLPVPPVLDIPYGLMRGVLGGDEGALRDSVARLVPGGLGYQRILGSLPPIPVVGGLQKETIGWDERTPEGMVPVRDAEGRLMKFAWPTDVIARGMGLDVGRWGDSAGLVGFLKKNQARIAEDRRGYLNSVMAGDTGTAKQLEEKFQQDWGVPLQVSQAQLQEVRQNRATVLPEMMLRQVNSDVRGILAPFVASRAGYLGRPDLTRAQATGLLRSGSRLTWQEGTNNRQADDDQEPDRPRTRADRAFSTFRGY